MEIRVAHRAQALPLTADDLDEFPSDGNRYEIIDGVLYVSATPSRAHQRMVRALLRYLDAHAEALGFEVLFAPVDVRMSPVTQVEPDLLVFPRAEANALETRWMPMSMLVLAVEVLSPSTAHVDRGRKRELYMGEGVAQYWIVDIEAYTVEVWTPGANVAAVLQADQVLQWQPVADVAPLVVELRALFDELM